MNRNHTADISQLSVGYNEGFRMREIELRIQTLNFPSRKEQN